MLISKILRGPAGIVAFAIIAVSIAIIGFLHFDPMCGEDVIQQQPSPDGRYVAVLMERNCGATTRYVEHINLRRANHEFWRDFIGGTISTGEVFTMENRNGGQVRFEWAGKDLNIEYPSNERAFLNSASWKDVHINYRNINLQ